MTESGAAATVILVVGAGAGLDPTLASLAANTPGSARIAVAGRNVPEDAGAALREIHSEARDADIVLVRAGALVADGWLERLLAALDSDSIVMTVSALCCPRHGHDLDDAAASIAAGSPRLRPTIPAALGGVCIVRGAGLELVDVRDGELEGLLASLSADLSSFGLVHVLADDVLIEGGDAPTLDDAESDAGSLRRATAVASTAVRPLAVTIDARALGSAATGMRTYILDLIAALAREESIALRVTLPPDTSPEVLAVLETDKAVELITYEQAAAGVPLTDIVHRPQQIFTADDLRLLRQLGRRIVVTHHDLIAYRAAAYHQSPEMWRDYRRVTRLSLAQADMVVFSSDHARDDALREDLVAPARGHVVPIGAERIWQAEPAAPVRPAAVPDGTRLLVCIGADYAHKNRPFAMALTRALHVRHGWEGKLVLAGPHVAFGSSAGRERELLAEGPEIESLVIDLGQIDDSARAWLYGNADAVVYPSMYEGFGYVPFEAADAGVPCLYAAVGALGELAGEEVAVLVPWDAQASADAAAPLLGTGDARDRHVSALREAAANTSWAAAVPRLREIYAKAVASPHRASAPRTAEDADRESFIVGLAASAEHERVRSEHAHQRARELQDANTHGKRIIEETEAVLERLRADVGALAEVADGGALSPAQRRGLLRVATRPALRRVLLAPFALLGRESGSSSEK